MPEAGCRLLLDAQLFAGVGAKALWGPRGVPDDVHTGVAAAGKLLEARFYLRADVDVLGAAGRGEGHVDGDVLFFFSRFRGREVYFVDEAEIDDVDGNLGVVATAQGA